MPHTTTALTFPGAEGQALAARLDAPSGPARAHAVFAHCFTCGKDIRAAATISRALADAGIAVLRFDFTGLGASAGDFADTTFSSNVADLVSAVSHVEAKFGPAPLLIGHSLGGAAVIQAAGRLPSVTAVATIGAPFDAGDVRRLLTPDLATIQREGEAVVAIAGRPFRIRRGFLEDLEMSSASDAIAQLRRPLLVFHGPDDEVVGIDNARRIFEAARHPKSFVSLGDADHLLSRTQDATYVANVLAAWATRYL